MLSEVARCLGGRMTASKLDRAGLSLLARCQSPLRADRQIELLGDDPFADVAREHESIKCTLVLQHEMRRAGNEASTHVAELARAVMAMAVARSSLPAESRARWTVASLHRR